MADDDATKLAVEAYLYGFPLVFNLEQVQRFVTSGVGSNPPAPRCAFHPPRQKAQVRG